MTRSTPRPLAALTALSTVVAALTLAPAARANDVPRFGEMPVGRMTTLPKSKAPAFVAAREKAPGFFIARPKFGSETPAYARHVSVVGEQKQADSIRQGNGGGDEEREHGTCFSESEMSARGLEEDDPEAYEWSAGQLRELNLWPKSKDNPTAGVRAVHSERVVEANGKVTLESVDAWVDPSTRGARVIAQATLPLVKVGAAIGGVKVYAARDERGGARRFVQFVVVRPGTPAAARAGAMMAMRQDGSGSQGNGCGHLRVPLAVDAKNGDTAVVTAPVQISSIDANAKTQAEAAGRTEAAAPTPPDDTEATKAKRRFRGKRRRPPPAPAPPGVVERETRTRDMQIHLSVSQTTRDKEPLVAVSFGWASRESVQRFMDDGTSAPPAVE